MASLACALSHTTSRGSSRVLSRCRCDTFVCFFSSREFSTSNTATLQSFNVATGDLLGELPVATLDDVTQAIAKSHQAQKTWAPKDTSERVQLLTNAFNTIIPLQLELAQLLSREMGKGLRQSTTELRMALNLGPKIAQEAAEALKPIQLQGGTRYYQPFGVAGIIAPWNYPVLAANNLIVPALMAGNTVVLKPSEETPLISQAFFGKLSQALPDNVITILQGDSMVGKWLVEGNIQMIGFTGSQAAGRDIMSRAAPKLKRLVMELGGNDCCIVLKDANLDRAARFIVANGFENSGQMCTSIERVYVDASVASQLEAKVVQAAKQYESNVGPWDQENVQIGPIIHTRQHESIARHIVDAEEKGGRFLVGSSLQTPPYITPTVIADMTREMILEQEETFGPVIGLCTFANVQEAIERANDSDYGLGAVVFGKEGAQQVAQALEVGMVGINQRHGSIGPWVGAKQSGFGYHGTSDGHRQFAQVKVIAER